MKLLLPPYLTLFSLISLCLSQQLPTEPEWWTSVCRGERLSQAMTWSSPQADAYIQPINSPFDGDMREDLTKWGYTQSEKSQFCDFDTFWGLQKAFNSLGVDPRSNFNHGSNGCFHASHGDPVKRHPNGASWALKDQTYTAPGGRVHRVTGGFSTIGVNSDAGMVFFISRKSAVNAAKQLWGQDPPKNELPALRSTSDFAWGFWNRVPHYRQGVTAFWSICVTNQQTLNILNLAFKTYKPPSGHAKVDSVQEWPGTEFEIPTVEAHAILGSPNGIAAGFFLAQHKQKLGGNKMIYKITVFKAVQPVTEDDFPNLIFWVKDVPPVYGGGDALASDNATETLFEEPKVLRRSEDGRNVLREHVIRLGSWMCEAMMR